MKNNQLEVGMLVTLGGDIVEVIEITPEGVVIECSENGQDIVSASSLSPLKRGMAYDDDGDIAEQYDSEPYRPSYRSGGMCEDAPCCGCCG